MTSATNSIFPGVALDRFAILNIVAGGIVTAAPLVFGALYARWTAKNPGPAADARISPHWLKARLPPGCNAVLPTGTLLTSLGDDPYPLPGDAPIHLTRTATAMLTDGSTIAPPMDNVTLSAGTLTTLLPDTLLRLRRSCTGMLLPGRCRQRLTRETPAQLSAGTPARLQAKARVIESATASTAMQADAAAVARLPADARVTLPVEAWVQLGDSRRAQLAPGTTVALPAGAAATFQQGSMVTFANREVSFPGGATATLSQAVGELPREWRSGSLRELATLDADASAPLADISYGPQVKITAQAGAGIKVPGDAIIGAVVDTVGQFPARVKAGQTIQVPLGSSICILAGDIIALPAGSVVAVKGMSVFMITNDGDALMAVASDAQDAPSAGDEAANHGDMTLGLPVLMTAPAGAEITVAGVADVMLPGKTTVEAPHRS